MGNQATGTAKPVSDARSCARLPPRSRLRRLAPQHLVARPRHAHHMRCVRSDLALFLSRPRPFAPMTATHVAKRTNRVRSVCESGEAKREQAACKPGSVTGPEGAGRWPFVWDARRRTPRAINPGSWAGNVPAEPCGPARRPYSILLPVGFALPPPSLAARCALTAPFHPCPAPRPFRSAESARPAGRFAFCGTFPGVAPAGHYPAPSSRGARTFLPPPAAGGHPSA